MRRLFTGLTLLATLSSFASTDYTDFYGEYEMVSGENCLERGYDLITIDKFYYNNSYLNTVRVDPLNNNNSTILFLGINKGEQTHRDGTVFGKCHKSKSQISGSKLTKKTKSCNIFDSWFYKKEAEISLNNNYLSLKYYHSDKEYSFECKYRKIAK